MPNALSTSEAQSRNNDYSAGDGLAEGAWSSGLSPIIP
jgi:hypothetical protein